MLSTVDKPMFGSAEPIILNIYIRNTENKDIIYFDSNPENDLQFSVQDSSGLVVPLTRYGSNLKSRRRMSMTRLIKVVLHHGEERRFRILINRIFDMSVPDTYSIAVSSVVGIGGVNTPTKISSQPTKVEVSGFDASIPPSSSKRTTNTK